MECCVLGPVGMSDGGVQVRLDGVKSRTVLAALVLADGRVVDVDGLVDHLWGAEPPATYRTQIHNLVSRLRKAFGRSAEIVRRPPGYVLHRSGAGSDLAEFHRVVRTAGPALDAGRAEDAAARLHRALSIWRGPALAGVSDRLLAVEGPFLEETRLAVLARRIELDLELGRHAALLPELTALVGRHPLREDVRAQLMTALHRCDRRGEALLCFREGRRLLSDELGVEPGARLETVRRAILATDDSAPTIPRPAVFADR